MTAGSALGFLINAAGGDIHRTWQQAAKSKQRGATSKRQGALCTELLSRFFFISALRQKLLDIFLMWGAEIKAGGGGRRKNEGEHALCDKTYPTAFYESSFTITNSNFTRI